MSLGAAVQMAELEHELGVRATFYVMVRSPYYNPFAYVSKRALSRIRELGHQLGLHVDLNLPRDAQISDEVLSSMVAHEHHLLGFSRKVSFHCPPTSVLWRDVTGVESAQGSRWEGRYFADSSGSFSYGDPEDSPVRPLQVNLHPVWWFTPNDKYAEFWR